jgi:diaminohydroxyphosphoribosylaminopyrimidine deaminase/5-amino-6-(5-phosphoribosylamino)uracil reductase
MTNIKDLESYMKIALDLAKIRKGLTHPNPTVGAVIVKDGKIIGIGYHTKAGMPHAEREAIKDAKEKGYDLKGSTMFVTLEPCCHYGRTPPCTNAIIEEGISEVVIGALDQNPVVKGQGVNILNSHGIKVITGVLEKECEKINEDFFTYIKEKRPFVHLKVAQSFDGKIATKTGDSKWITSEKSRQFAHQLRKEASAILVGTNTALKDNPTLTVRHVETEKQPVRILIDKRLKVPPTYNIYNNEAKTIVITSKLASQENLKRLSEIENVEIVFLDLDENEKFKVDDILKTLYEREIVHLLVEGGREVITDFIKERKFDKISIFTAPLLIGDDGISWLGCIGIEKIQDSLKLRAEDFKVLDKDFYFECYPMLSNIY